MTLRGVKRDERSDQMSCDEDDDKMRWDKRRYDEMILDEMS